MLAGELNLFEYSHDFVPVISLHLENAVELLVREQCTELSVICCGGFILQHANQLRDVLIQQRLEAG